MSTLRVNLIEPYSGASVTIDADLTVTGKLTGPSSILSLGTDASGTNAAATNVTQTAPLSTGNATPAALVWQVGVQGASGATPQTLTEGFRVQEIANATTREVFARSPVVWAGLPTDTAAVLLIADAGLRVGNRMDFVRAAAVPAIRTLYVNGTLQAPTTVANGNFLGQWVGSGYNGTSVITGATIEAVSRQTWTGSVSGTRWRVSGTDVGSTGTKALVSVQGGGTNIAELVSEQPTFRIIPGATQFAIRDSGNTADTFTVNAAGTAIYAPIATAVGIGTSSNNAAAILQADSTTRGFLPPRMTTTQRDAISSPPAGLLIYNTTTNKLNVYTTAWEAITSA